MDQTPQDGGYYPMAEEPKAEEVRTDSAEKPKKKNKEPGHKTLLRVIISILIVAVGIYLILFLVARAAMYDSIGSMLQHMFVELSVMWQRILA